MSKAEQLAKAIKASLAAVEPRRAYAEMFYRYNPRAAMIGTRGGPFLCVRRIL